MQYIQYSQTLQKKDVVYLRSLLRSDYEQLIVKPVYYYQRMTFDEVSDVLSVIEIRKTYQWTGNSLTYSELKTLLVIMLKILSSWLKKQQVIFKQHTILEFKNYIKFDERVLECLYCRYMLNEIDASFPAWLHKWRECYYFTWTIINK